MEELTTKCAKTFSQSTLRIFISQSAQSIYTEHSKDIFLPQKALSFLYHKVHRVFTQSTRRIFFLPQKALSFLYHKVHRVFTQRV